MTPKEPVEAVQIRSMGCRRVYVILGIIPAIKTTRVKSERKIDVRIIRD
jgi:hypothetical protein